MSYGVGLRNGVAFALGTIPSLTSGGGLRPSLLLDFLSGSLDPRITFSRGTQAMQYGLDGTLQYAPNNLLTYSNQADNAAWTKSNSFVQTNLITQSNAFTTAPWNFRGTAALTANATTAPDGTNTGWLVTGIGVLLNDLFQQITVASGVAYTPSFWIKRVSTTGTLQIANPAGSNGAMNLNMALLSDNWERITPSHPAVTVTSAFAGSATNTGGIHLLNSSGGLLSFYLYGSQVVLGSVPGDYRATTSAALPVLYADYTGALRARKLCETAITGTHNISQNATVVGGAIYTDSIYVKAGERTSCRVINYDNGANYAWIYVDLTNGNTLNSGVTGTVSNQSFTVTSAGLGWYRISIVAGLAATTRQLRIDTAVGASENTTGDGSSGIYIADAQLTPGYLPLAVTETTSAAVYGPRFDYDPSSLVTQNLLTYSQQIGGGNWITSGAGAVTQNYVAAPNGTLTATRITNTGAFSEYIQTTVAPSTAYVFSFYAKNNGGTIANYRVYNNTGGADIIAQTSYLSSINSADYVRVSVAFTTPAGCTQINVYPHSSATLGGADVIVWGAQLNQGSTALPYTATTTAPYTLTTARGLLIEEQRVNSFTVSNDFTNVAWQNTNVTVTAASTTSPEGVVNASKLAATSSAATAFYQQGTIASTAATFSVYVKQGTSATVANTFGLRNITTLTNLVFGTFNYSTGVFTYTVGSSGVVVTNVGNGWWRIAITSTTGITAGDLCAGYVGTSGAVATAGDFLYAYGAQLEAGAFATSYIPTVASTATRNADSASITTLTPWFNATQGTLYAAGSNFVPDADSTVRILATLTDTISLTNAVRLERVTNLWRDVQTVAGVASVASGTWTFGTNGKVVGAYQSSNSAATFNGATPTAVGTATMPSGITALGIGCNTSTGNSWNGWISSIRYYPTRLPNASLQSITV